MMRRLLALWAAAAALCALSGCGARPVAAEIFAMDTVMNFTAYGGGARQAVDAAAAEMNRLERLLSRTRSGSDVQALNSAGGSAVSVHAETGLLLRSALEYGRATGGAFDVTLAPVSTAWGFTTDRYQVPSQAELEALLPAVGSEKLSVNGAEIRLLDGAQVDLGGIAKGYAADRAEAIYAENGVERGAIYLGGNVYVRGCRPDGAPWRIGVQDPQDPGGFAGVLLLEDAFAVTSGGYQRYFEQGGVTYHHILDPETGYPADSGLLSVTVVAAGNGGSASGPGRGTMCDAFSTALYVMGEDAAAAFWRQGGYDFEMVLITGDGRVLVTEGLEDSFEQEAASGYVYETIGRAAAETR